MVRESSPPQYDVILSLLSENADLFCNLARELAASIPQAIPGVIPTAWNIRTAGFEVTTYLLFHLWHSLKLYQHDPAVAEGITDYCEVEIAGRHKATIQECPDLLAVIDRRLKIYTDTINNHADKGWGRAMHAVHEVLAHCLASSAVCDKVQSDFPLVLADFIEQCFFVIGLDTVEIRVPFACCLKHLFVTCTNITTMPVREMLQHISEGVAEHTQICRDSGV
jgi:hypothetical protein